MLSPGIYYVGKNAHRQLLRTLPGKYVYPTDSNFIYYSEQKAFYVNQVSSLNVDDEVRIYVNGELHGTTKVVDASGLYVYELSLEYGILEIQSVFPDASTATQNFFCVQLYSLLLASAEIWSEYRRQNLLIIANNYLVPMHTGIFRGQADQQAMSDNFGAAIGFRQPFDWPFDRYALAMAGDEALGLPGIYPALVKGSSVGAVKDIVQAVTGYTMTNEDFRLIQGIGWQFGPLSGDNYRYRYSGNPLDPVEDRDPTGVSGPHFFLAYNQYEVELPVTMQLELPAFIIGGTVTYPAATSGVTYAAQISIDGDSYSGPFFVAGLFSSGEAVAAAIQADMRRIGVQQGFGMGWRYCIVTYNQPGAPQQYVFISGNSQANGAVDSWVEGTGGLERPQLGEGYRTFYSPGYTMWVYINGVLIDPSKYTARTIAGITKVWIRDVVKDDEVTIEYKNTSGGDESYTFTAADQTSILPIASFRSNIQQAYTEVLRIVHDGFLVLEESVIRDAAGDIDYLSYDWLNPWANLPEYTRPPLFWSVYSATVTNPATLTYDVGESFESTSPMVLVNGSIQAPSRYTISGTQFIFDASVTLTVGDIIEIWYCTASPTVRHYEETIVGTPSSPYLITLPSVFNTHGIHVFVNGDRLSTDQYTILSGDSLEILGPLDDEDEVYIRYFEGNSDFYEEITIYGPPPVITFSRAIDPDSIMIYVNGQALPPASFTQVDDTHITLIPAVLAKIEADDVLSVVGNIIGLPGFSVYITQDSTVYLQGAHFKVDYTTGKILWLTPTRPAPGTAYLVDYTYFPKKILEQLLLLVKPATIKLEFQFETTDGHIFNPYWFNGQPNPTGELIIP